MAEEAGLNLTLWETTKTGFLVTRPNCHQLLSGIPGLPNVLTHPSDRGKFHYSNLDKNMTRTHY